MKMKASDYKALQLKRALAPKLTYNPPFTLDGWGPKTMRWIEHASQGLRVIDAVKRLGNQREVGYYTDNHGGETTRPMVLQLPAANVKGARCERYMAACTDPYNDDCYLTDCDIVDNLHDACQWAYRLAERYAESCRDDDAVFQAQCQIEDAAETICGLRLQHSALVEELRRQRALCSDIPLLVKTARDALRSLRKDVAKAAARIKQLREDPAYAVH